MVESVYRFLQVGNPVVSKLSELLDDRDLEVRTKVAEGLCKLMMSKVITSSRLFTRLILMWYNPVTDANGRLRHVLGAFFPLYASLAKENQDTISEAFMPTLKTLGSAPVTSPLTGVDMEDVGLFLIQLTNRDFLQTKEADKDSMDNCHDSIAYAICNAIIADPLCFHVKLFVKLLTNLGITVDDYNRLKEFKALYAQMIDGVKDKLCLKSLEKFGKRVETYLEQNPNPTEENEEQNNTVPQTNEENEEANNATTTMNNTTKLLRKRQLFSQTCNTLLEENSEELAADENKPNSIKDLVESKKIIEESEDDSTDDDLFATPKSVSVSGSDKTSKKLRQRGEIEITRVEESPLTEDEEIVSGNLNVLRSKNVNKLELEGSDDEINVSLTTSTQVEKIQPRRSSKRLAKPHKSLNDTTSTESEEAEEDSKKSMKRSSKGKVKPVELSKPQRKSRRLDSSTGSSETDSSASKGSAKKRTRR